MSGTENIINSIPIEQYRTCHKGFLKGNTNYDDRKYCLDYGFCKENPCLNYLNHFQKIDANHCQLATIVSGWQAPPYSPSVDVTNSSHVSAVHEKLTSITPKDLLPSWTDYPRREYVDHYYAVCQLNRSKYLNDNIYGHRYALDYFKSDEPLYRTSDFGEEFFTKKPRTISFKHPWSLPLNIYRDPIDRSRTKEYIYAYGRAEGN